MTTFGKKLHKEAQKIRMRVAERRELREQIVSYMEYHPMSLAEGRTVSKKKARKGNSSIPTSEKFVYIHVGKWFKRPTVAVLAVLFVVSIPFAAERSAPGDVLYPVKVRITESVLSQLSFTPYQKIELETWRVERRIAEARLLAKEGKLTDEAEASISETVRGYTENAQKELNALREDDADEAAIAQVVFESALDVQTAVLETESASSTLEGEEDPTDSIATVVREARANVVADGVAASSSVPSYEKLSARLEERTTRARELFSSINGSVTEGERSDIERRLEDIDRLIVAAGHMQEMGDTEVAIRNLKDALRDTQTVIRFMTDIDVRLSVGLERLVPKKLTNDERTDLLDELLREIDMARGETLARVNSSDDQAFQEKVMFGIGELDVMLGDIGQLIASGTLAEAETLAVEAHDLAKDLAFLTADLQVSDSPAEVIDPESEEEVSEEEVSDEAVEVAEEGEEASTTEAVSGEVVGEE